MATTQEESQPDKVWLRSESLGEERSFNPDHAAQLQALEAQQGHSDWLPITAPSPTPDTAGSAADDPKPRQRTRSTRKPR